MRKLFALISLVLGVLSGLLGWFYPSLWIIPAVVLALIGLGIYDMLQTSHTILRNFPVVGHFRYLFESISPEIQQYFIERDTDGTPISRNHRDIVYQRAKDVIDTHPFGTELDLYNPNYEGFKHSMFPAHYPDEPPRIRIGGPDCKQPYEASILNISAMSFGSLSKNAIMAMNKGAREDNFYHNTGEGGLSKYHQQGGDIVWQIGTGYFGCRTEDGRFNPDAFKEKAGIDEVKMIELKLSQGAKPGHGGVLPASKNTPEIAEIRMLEPYTDVLSPPGHQEFSDPQGLLKFIKKLRDLSGGKPTGFKLCIGRVEEFIAVCEAMKETGIQPDFITVDGAEGGTGAAPLEFSDSVGMPIEPALEFVDQKLREYGLRDDIKLIASGKVITAASLLKMISLGADLCNSARAFMMAVGCIQALRCNTNNCPTGVATQKPGLVNGLVVEDKYKRVANFHRNTVEDALELMAACGVTDLDELTPDVFLDGSEWAK